MVFAVAQIVELHQRGVSLEGLHEDTCSDATALCELMTDRVIDAVLALGLWEQAWDDMWSQLKAERGKRDTWERDREAERIRERELAAQSPPPPGERWSPEHREWEDGIRERAQRDVVRAKWASGQLPNGYRQQLPSLHARSFVLALAQIERALRVLAKLETGAAKIELKATYEDFKLKLPTVVNVRDSIEHAEDRMRSLGKQQHPLVLQPIDNPVINAPGGGVFVSDSLNDRMYGCTVADGSFAEVEISDATVEIARAAVQRALDALPWERNWGYRRWIPNS
jgi:hypothetical protein